MRHDPVPGRVLLHQQGAGAIGNEAVENLALGAGRQHVGTDDQHPLRLGMRLEKIGRATDRRHHRAAAGLADAEGVGVDEAERIVQGAGRVGEIGDQPGSRSDRVIAAECARVDEQIDRFRIDALFFHQPVGGFLSQDGRGAPGHPAGGEAKFAELFRRAFQKALRFQCLQGESLFAQRVFDGGDAGVHRVLADEVTLRPKAPFP